MCLINYIGSAVIAISITISALKFIASEVLLVLPTYLAVTCWLFFNAFAMVVSSCVSFISKIMTLSTVSFTVILLCTKELDSI